MFSSSFRRREGRAAEIRTFGRNLDPSSESLLNFSPHIKSLKSPSSRCIFVTCVNLLEVRENQSPMTKCGARVCRSELKLFLLFKLPTPTVPQLRSHNRMRLIFHNRNRAALQVGFFFQKNREQILPFYKE